jgi:7,8-dihydro-6-hydroxymethylpterin-pyrophosphokinase
MYLETAFGRVRGERWAARTLDLDLLVYQAEARSTETLQLPHPRMLERAFVTEPLRELLGRSPFVESHWDDLRQKLGAEPRSTGVRRLNAPL